jgi:glycosyltransferase involved in cell wall biosynthesis
MVGYTYYESDPRVIREAEAALEGGYEVDFLALRRTSSAQTEIIRGVRVIRLKQQKYRGRGHFSYLLAYLTFFLRCLIKTTTLFVSRRYSVIHVNNMPDFLVFSTVIPWLFGSKIILDIHDPMPNTFASKFKSRENGLFYRLLLLQERISAMYSSQVVTVHDPVKYGILVEHGLKPAAVEVVANFADEKLFPLRHSFDVKYPIRFVFHGTILERSGLRILIDALDRTKHRDDMSVKIIGEGDFSDRLRKLIVDLKLDNIVQFENRSYPAHEIAEHINDCQVGLAPLEISSVTDYALPLKLLEYISLGLPVVVVRNKAIKYYFGEEDCMFFDWDNPQSLADVFDKIVENPEILQHYRARSISLRDRFSWSGEKQKYIELLDRLLAVRRSEVVCRA